SVSSCSLGITPASESLVALTIIMNRMRSSLMSCEAFSPQLSAFLDRHMKNSTWSFDSFPYGGTTALAQLWDRGDHGVVLEHLTNFDFQFSPELRDGTALDPLDGFTLRLHIPEPVTTHEFLRLGERAVNHRRLASRKSHTSPLRIRLKPLQIEQDTRFRKVVIIFGHLSHEA